MLEKAFCENATSKPRVYEWYKYFQEGHEDTEDDKRIRLSSTSTTEQNVEKVKGIMVSNRQITIRETT